MSDDFSPELGLSQEELLERLISHGLARKVKKRIGGRTYGVLAIDSKVLGRLGNEPSYYLGSRCFRWIHLISSAKGGCSL